MNADEESVEELLRMAEHVANTGDVGVDPGVTGRRIQNEEAENLIKEGYVNIWQLWSTIVALRDKGLAYAIGAVWVPEDLLDADIAIESSDALDGEGRFRCVLSSRVWFDEDKLMPDDTDTIYKAIDIVVGLCRSLGGPARQLLERLMKGETDGDDSESD